MNIGTTNMINFFVYSAIPILVILRLLFFQASYSKILKPTYKRSDILDSGSKRVLFFSLLLIVINLIFLLTDKFYLFSYQNENGSHNFIGSIGSIAILIFFAFGRDERMRSALRVTKLGLSSIDFTMPQKFVRLKLALDLPDLPYHAKMLFKELKTENVCLSSYPDFGEESERLSAANWLVHKNLASISEPDLFGKVVVKINPSSLPYVDMHSSDDAKEPTA